MTKPGRFITVEGVEGVGKSSNMDYLAELIRDAGFEVVCTREPGGTAIAEDIRKLLLAHNEEAIPAVAESLLFFAARRINLDNLIKPALKAGRWVLCDRFTDASRAYQGGGRGIDRDMINRLADWVQEGLEPDMTLLLDAPVATGLARASGRGAADRMESENLDFFERVREAYLELAETYPERIRIIDASVGLEQVQAQIKREITPLISDKLS